jgi:hypothetical protein
MQKAEPVVIEAAFVVIPFSGFSSIGHAKSRRPGKAGNMILGRSSSLSASGP